MANKVRFGLRNVKYAIYSNGTYGTPVAFPGAVNLNVTREGGDSSDFYADDGVYFTFAGTNGGYTLELEMAKVTDAIRVALLGEVADSNGVQFEYSGNEPAEFALIFETQGDESPTAFTFYGCKASRIETSAQTKGESPEVDTDTMSIRASGTDFTVGTGADAEVKHAIQSHITKTTENATTYASFFTAVATPSA